MEIKEMAQYILFFCIDFTPINGGHFTHLANFYHFSFIFTGKQKESIHVV
jgi:hypothetical protein